MLKRKIEDALLEWKRTKTNQGLLVTGARQVGKTTSIESFASSHYEHMVKIDFVQQPDAVETIGAARDPDDLVLRISAVASQPISQGNTLLFFDEVQRCADSITWMRYLAQDDRFDVIYSGSMLGIDAYNFRSLPVGTIDILEMFPMDFEEFTWASGVDPVIWGRVRACFDAAEEVPDFIHERLSDIWTRYVLVGGMPDAVQSYVSTHDTTVFRARQRSILDAYRADITRYVDDRTHAQRIKTIYNAIPAQLHQEKKRFYVSGIDKNKRFAEMQSDFDWLENAGVALLVKKAAEALFPLGMTREDSYFKMYLNDVGLLFSTFSAADVESIVARKDMTNFGMAFENAVAQELRAHGRPDLYYFSKAKVGEVDFLIEDKHTGEVIPIEVKSGKYSTKHAALDALMAVKNYGIRRAVVLHTRNVSRSQDGRVTYLPIYMAGLL